MISPQARRRPGWNGLIYNSKSLTLGFQKPSMRSLPKKNPGYIKLAQRQSANALSDSSLVNRFRSRYDLEAVRRILSPKGVRIIEEPKTQVTPEIVDALS